MRPMSLLLALAACATGPVQTLSADTGAALLPVDEAAPPLVLAATPLVPGHLFTLQVTGATAGDTVWFVYGTQAGTLCPPALNGACVDVRNPTVIGSAVAGPAGVATFVATPPITMPVGATVRFQAAVPALAAVSNAISSTAIGDCGDGLLHTNEGCDDGNNAAGDGCDTTCQPEVLGDSFRVEVVSAQVTSSPPAGGLWDDFAIIAPFTNPDLYVSFAINGVVLGRTYTIDDTIRPTWNAATVIDVYPGESLLLSMYDEDPVGLPPEFVRSFSLSRAQLDAHRDGGPFDLSGGPVRRLTIDVTTP